MRLIFMGTPDFALTALQGILNKGHNVVAVYSQPPRKSGRGMSLRKSPVHEFAENNNIPVETPVSFKTEEAVGKLKEYAADIIVVVAYGLILPKSILEATKHGCFNIHASLLPRWRGAAPINRAIMAGDRKTGVMIMKMDEGLDTGDICLGAEISIDTDMTAGQLHDELAMLGSKLIIKVLEKVSTNNLEFMPQPTTGVTYAEKISKQETKIDWNQNAADVHNHIMGLSPFPGAWCEMVLSGSVQRVKILKSQLVEEYYSSSHPEPGAVLDDRLLIACSQGAVRLTKVQRSGKSVMDASEFLRGYPIDKASKVS